jgi:hypothetical protein
MPAKIPTKFTSITLFHERSFCGMNGQNRQRAIPIVFHHQGEAAVNCASPLMTQQMDASGLSASGGLARLVGA